MTYTLTPEAKKLDKLDFSNRHFDGNLLISGARCSEINLENCKIDRNVIIDNNNSIVKLTGSTINGTIVVNYVKDGNILHFDKLNDIDANHNCENIKLSKNYEVLIKSDVDGIKIKEKNLIFKNSGEIEYKKKVIKNGEVEYETRKISKNSLLIINSQIKINLDSSKFKGDVFILESTIVSGTLDMSNAVFGSGKNNKFNIESTGINGDIEAKNACFNGKVKFEDIRFDNEIYFSNSNFFEKVEFVDCTMYQECYFENATFKANVFVSETIFQGKASFKNIKWENDAYLKMYCGSAFYGYVDMTDQDLSNYLFINVRGLRNIFYSLINDNSNDPLQHIKVWSAKCKSLYKKENISRLIKAVYKLERKLNTIICSLKRFINKDENIGAHNIRANQSSLNYKELGKEIIDVEIEMYIEARRAMEDMGKEDLISECHIMEMEAQRRKSSTNFVKWFRYTFLKYTTKYGESPFRIFAFIIFDWLFFSFLYWLIIKGHEIAGSHFPYIHDDFIERSYIEGMYHSADNLLSLNLNIDNSCCIYTVILTLLQGFINIMIIALMTQVVFRKLDLR